MRCPSVENAAARFAVSVDLPTPPFPLAIASTRVLLSRRDSLRALADAAAELLGQRGLLVGGHDVELEADALDAVERRNPTLDLVLEARAERATGDGERDRDGHVTLLDTDVAHHVELGHGTPELGVDDLFERLVDLVAKLAIPVERTQTQSHRLCSAKCATVAGGRQYRRFRSVSARRVSARWTRSPTRNITRAEAARQAIAETAERERRRQGSRPRRRRSRAILPMFARRLTSRR